MMAMSARVGAAGTAGLRRLSAPAEVFSLPKGIIEVGRDADLMVVDPRTSPRSSPNICIASAVGPHTRGSRRYSLPLCFKGWNWWRAVLSSGSVKEGMWLSPEDQVDLSELEGRNFTCTDGCGLAACASPSSCRTRKVVPVKVSRDGGLKNEPHRHYAMAMKKAWVVRLPERS